MRTSKELKQYVTDRMSKIMIEVEKTEEWRELNAEHEKVFNDLCEILPQDGKEKLDMLINAMVSQYTIGNCAIYKAGLMDGISLKNEIPE